MRSSRRLHVSERDRAELERLVRNGNTPQKVVLRARIVLLSGERVATGEVMRQLATTTPTITRWRQRYEASGVGGLVKDKNRPGRKRQIEEGEVREVVERTLREKPPAGTHWSTRSMAKAVGLSPARTAALNAVIPVSICDSRFVNDYTLV